MDNPNLEKLLVIISLGLVEAIKNNAISINEAEVLLFNPGLMSRLEKLNVQKEIIDLLHMGTEIEDIASLLPNKLSQNLDELVGYALGTLKKIPEIDTEQTRWYEKIIPSPFVPPNKDPRPKERGI